MITDPPSPPVSDALPAPPSPAPSRLARTQVWFSALAALVSTIAGIIGVFVKLQQDHLATIQKEIQVQQENLVTEQKRIANEQESIKTAQLQLTLHTDTAKQTQDFTKIAEDYLKLLSIEDKKQLEAIHIDLLDAIALATVSSTGKPDPRKLEEMPLSLALATHNVEALGLIGLEDERRKTWLRMASNSGDPAVRGTAMAALARSSAVDPVNHLQRIFELSANLTDEETLDEALRQICYVVGVMERNSNPERFRDDANLKPVADRLIAMRTGLPSGSAQVAADPATTKKAVQRAEMVDRAAGFFQTANRGNSSLFSLFRSDQAPPPTPVPNAELTQVVEGLKADDTANRQRTRDTLSQKVDSAGVGIAFDALLVDPASYRVRIGVATALWNAKQPVIIADDQQAAALVTLIGDDDVLVRKYASESLMKLTDRDTVRRVQTELLKVIRNRDKAPKNPNAVYNAVVILGTWLRILPPSLNDSKKAIAQDLVALQKELAGSVDWKNTSRLVGEMLAAANRRVAAD